MTDDIRFQVECLSTDLVLMLVDKYHWNVSKSLDVLYGSKTFSKLSDPECGLYFQGSEYVFQYLQHEIETGVMA